MVSDRQAPMLVATTPDLEQLVTEFSGAGAYALDTEFHGEGRYYPRLAVIQLAVPGRVAVVDATAIDPRHLQPLFAGPGVAVTHAGGQDLEIINRACGAHPSRVFDTQIAAGFLGYSSASLATLVRVFLNRSLDKGSVLSDWFQRPLSAGQIAYAEADVAHLLELRGVLETRLADLGRLEWAIEECERRGLLPSPDIATAWWRLKGATQLKALARARAQELAAWRERTAQVADRSVRTILPDEAIIALAERPPRSAADFPKSRLFDPRRLSTATVGEVIAAAARGADLPPEDLRLPPSSLPLHLQGVAGLIAAWVQEQARQLSIDPALLATRRDIEAFLQNEPDSRLGQAWRAEVIGATVGRIATGRAAVAYDGTGALVLVNR
jgi:ribonuclease D